MVEAPPTKRRKLQLSLSKSRRSSPTCGAEQDTYGEGGLCPAAAVECSRVSTAEEKEEDEAYFSANFKAVCGSVLAEDCPERSALTDRDRDTFRRFMGLPGVQQQLYVRLFLRKHQWLRVHKLNYSRIAEDLVPVTTELISKKFLLSEEDLCDWRETLNLLQVSELKQLCREMKMNGAVQRCQKAEIIQALFAHSQQHKPLFGSASFLDVVVKRAKAILGRCVCVSPEPVEVFSKCLLLHSLSTSLTSSWTEEGESAFSEIIYQMLQVKIGQVVFPEYEVYITDPLFSSAEDFSRFYAASRDLHSIVAAVENKEDSDDMLSLIRRTSDTFQRELEGCCETQGFMEKMTTGWVLAKTLTSGVEYLEKRGDYGEAVELLQQLLGQSQYGRSLRGHWLERLSLNLDFHLRERDKCLEVIRSAVLEERGLHPARRLSVIQRAHKILQTHCKTKNRKHGGSGISSHFTTNDFPLPDITQAKEVVIEALRYSIDNRPQYAIPSQEEPDVYSFVSVEGLAMHHYSTAESWPCAVHAEKSTFSLLFSLLMWDVIFCSGVPNVFRTRMQARPLDLLTDDFYTKRKECIETRLKWIEHSSSEFPQNTYTIHKNFAAKSYTDVYSSKSEELGTAVENTWESRNGQVCYGADWEILPTVEDAKSLAVCMGGELLSKVCKHFSMFYNQSCGGLPDLTLWNPSSGTFKFVEVKGPGDRLSNKQIVWLSRLSSWGCQVEVCRVKAQTK